MVTTRGMVAASRRRTRWFLAHAACACALGLAGEAHAADTLETFEAGATDLELYLGYDGLGASRSEHVASSDLFFGYGVAHRLSVFAGLLLQADHALETTPDLYGGLFGTVVDGELLDIDLLLSVDAMGPGLRSLQVSPGAELNLDSDSSAGPWGLYIRMSAPLTDLHDGPTWLFELHPGVHWSPFDGHQLLLELSSAVHPPGPEVGPRLEAGGAALGYNVALSEGLELITQASLSFPRAGSPITTGLTIGCIATPGALVRRQ